MVTILSKVCQDFSVAGIRNNVRRGDLVHHPGRKHLPEYLIAMLFNVIINQHPLRETTDARTMLGICFPSRIQR
jgi:hypothetical protein